MWMRVSVIVPVYNTAPYLHECVDSLLAQSLQEMEIILIDAGSTDGSGAILKEYEALHPQKLRVITCPGRVSVGEARNIGLRAARGECIGFVDSDDYIAHDMYEQLLGKLLASDLCMVCCDTLLVYAHRTQRVSSGICGDLTEPDAIRRSLLRVYATVWNKLYKKELLCRSGVLFKEGVLFEDVDFLYRLYPHMKRIGSIDEVCYFYRQREGAITNTFDERLYQLVTNFDGILEEYRSIGKYEEYKDELEFLYVRYAYATMPKRLALIHDYGVYKKGVRFAKQQVQAHFPDYRRNPLFKTQGLKGRYLRWYNGLFSRLVYLSQRRRHAL
jgi:glycosyltransferase involved in cell wall biosynthesis